MAKSDRLLLILNLLRSRRNLKASGLANECEVSERTIYRDIQALSQARVPIYFDHGYRLLTDAFLPPLNFTVDELLTVYLGLSSDPVQSVNCLRKSAKQVLAKIESLMPEKIKADYQKTKERITVQPEKKRSQKGEALMFELLRQAISQEKKIKLHCVSAHSSNVIELVPKALVYQKGNWYLAGEIQKKTRYFRLDMIKSVSLS
ncbi:MAG: HTH domain-containing protein [candidate division Zixibacteria bacterium]|nr:HTH domain-containing protein [candidate division Zixibacteria bacterium]